MAKINELIFLTVYNFVITIKSLVQQTNKYVNMGQKQQSTIGELTGLGTLNKKFSPASTQMTSKNQHSTSSILDHVLNVNVLMFAFLAIMFFNLGRSYSEIKMKMEERKNKRASSFAHNMYKKNDDMDEERQQMNDENEYLRTVRAELEESR